MEKRYGKKNIRGQSQISFGMIFSIILIIVFVAFAIYGITKFLDIQKTAQIGKFKSDLQNDINNIWKSAGSSSSSEKTYYIPKSIKQVCFQNPTSQNDENMFFIPTDKFKGSMIENINMAGTLSVITSGPRRLCIDNKNGKVSLMLKKEYNENSVTISK